MSTGYGQGHGDVDSDPATIWGHNPPTGLSSASSFSSAVRRSETTPSKRRRGSDGPTRHARTDDPDHNHHHDERVGPPRADSHSRSRTMDDEVGSGSGKSTNLHPLRSSASQASSSSWTLDHETRPSLRRMLSDRDLWATGTRVDGDEMGPRESLSGVDREMLVIVHEVQPKDSLAGVALRYGIALAELRRANQLWTSDSIHLRKVLYIPVDKTRQAKRIRAAFIDAGDPLESVIPSTNLTAVPAKDSSPDFNLLDVKKLTIRRVPASQLLYFPPPTHPSTSANNHVPKVSATFSNGSRRPQSRPALPVTFARPGESPLQGVLDVFSSSLQTTVHHVRAYTHSTSSLFGGSAARVPTLLASRLSLDSASGTPSSTSDDFDWEHEMEEVSTSKASRRKDARDSHGRARARHASASLNDLHASPPPALRREDERESVELELGPFFPAQAAGSSPPSPTSRTPTRRHQRGSESQSQHAGGPPSPTRGRAAKQRPVGAVPYVGAEAAVEWGSPPAGRGASAVRTAQMEPSPGMQLPVMTRRRTTSGGS